MLYLIASYPRSGNHLVRFLVEYLTGRPTLGSRGNPRDVPIHLNAFDDPSPLAHVAGAPIAAKVHDECHVRELTANDAIAGSILVLRRPEEALIAHLSPELRRPNWLWYPWFLHRLHRGTLHYCEIIRAVHCVKAPILVLQYEALISSDESVYCRQIARLTSFLGAAAIKDRAVELEEHYPALRAACARAGGRDWPGVRSAFSPSFYRERATAATLAFISWSLNCRSGILLPLAPQGASLGEILAVWQESE